MDTPDRPRGTAVPPTRRLQVNAWGQGDLFDAPADAAGSPAGTRASQVLPASASTQWTALSERLHGTFGGRLYLGTSSWSFPGWRGLVWDERDYSDAALSRQGLEAYARHPLLRTVSLDRTFYRALDAAGYARLAEQTPPDFRFVVKAPSQITDAAVRAPESGAPLRDNVHFLDARLALDSLVAPALEGLGERLGVLVFQLPPLPVSWLRNQRALLDRLAGLWQAVTLALPPGVRVALELRDARLLTAPLIAQLAAHRVAYCVGLHDQMPLLAQQMAASQGAGGGGDFICRWSLRQGLRYNQAKAQWTPFDRLQAPDPLTREALAQAIVGTLSAGHRAFVTINNKAEGCAPLSVVELARAILQEAGAGT